MVKYFEAMSAFFYSWDQVAQAFWMRYPNPYSTHVLTEDTLTREMRGPILYSKRILTKTNRMPKWGEKLVPTSNTLVCIVEESYINPEEKTIVTHTRNIGYNRIMDIVERVTYTQSQMTSNETLIERRAWIGSSIYGLRRAIEGFGLDRFRKNCSKAALGFEYVLNRLYMTPGGDLTSTAPTTSHLPNKFEETTEKFKEKAKRASEIASKRAKNPHVI